MQAVREEQLCDTIERGVGGGGGGGMVALQCSASGSIRFEQKECRSLFCVV